MSVEVTLHQKTSKTNNKQTQGNKNTWEKKFDTKVYIFFWNNILDSSKISSTVENIFRTLLPLI